MHLAKGLEFRAVVVMACDDEVIPLQERIETVGDDADLQEVYDTERHLLYVACTRARDHLLITSVEPASDSSTISNVTSARTRMREGGKRGERSGRAFVREIRGGLIKVWTLDDRRRCRLEACATGQTRPPVADRRYGSGVQRLGATTSDPPDDRRQVALRVWRPTAGCDSAGQQSRSVPFVASCKKDG